MRLFHTSDTHLGHQQYPRTGPDGLNVREQDMAKAFLAVIDRAVAKRPDLFLHAGDLFDGVRPGNRALATAMEGFVRLDRAGIPTVVIAGNHEHPRMRGTGSPFRLFEHLPNVHAVYKGRREQLELDTPAGPVRVQAVPQCPDNQALAEEVAAVGPAPDDRPQILVVHGSVTSLEAFAHAEFNGQDLDPAWFDDRFDYVALGHFHGTRQVAPNAWYCGASERVSIAEAPEEKGFLDVSLPDPRPPSDQSPPPTPDARFRPLPVRPYVDLPPLDATGMDAPGLLEAGRRAIARVPEGAVARLRIDDVDASLRGSLDLKTLRDAASGCLHLDLRITWADRQHSRPGGLEIGGLQDEWRTFLATRPVEGVDRARLDRMAAEVLEGST